MFNSLVTSLHWGALLGVGWNAADPGSIYSTSSSAAVTAGAYDIPVSGNLGFNPGMLVTYQGVDGEWHPFRLRSSAGTLLRSDRPLPVAMASGAKISNVYADRDHPNLNGGAMVADVMLRQLADPAAGRAREVERVFRESSGAWSGSSAASVSFAAVADYRYLGSDVTGERGASFSGSGASGAVWGPFFTPLGGDYLASAAINTGMRGGSENAVQMSIEEQQPDGSVVTLATGPVLAGFDATYLAEVLFHSDGSKPVRMRVTSIGAATSWTGGAGQQEFHRLVSDAPVNLDAGKVVLFGDSWLTPSSPIAQRVTARLFNATVVALGVGGNKAADLIARFNAQVTPENPTTVIVCVGTNDYYAGTSPSSFESDLGSLRSSILTIGAQPVFLTSSVGPDTSPAKFFPSRRFMTYVRYLIYAEPIPAPYSPWRSLPFNMHGVRVPAGGAVTVFASPGVTRTSAILRFLAIDHPDLILEAGFSPDTRGEELTDGYRFASGKIVRNWWMRRAIGAVAGHMCLRVVNPTGIDVVTSIAGQFDWKGDLV